jgi:hypothetical protein
MKPRTNSHHNNHNIFGELNLKITFDILVFSIAISAIATILHGLIPKDYRDTLTFAATTFATSAGALGAFYAYKNLSQSTNSKMIDRTSLYFHRWNDPQYIPLREASSKIFEQMRQHPPEEKDTFLIEYFEAHPEEKQKVITILNFLTEMSLYIEKGYVDEDFLKSYFQLIVEDYCEEFHALINQRRGYRHNKDIYKRLIDINERWKLTKNHH